MYVHVYVYVTVQKYEQSDNKQKIFVTYVQIYTERIELNSEVSSN